MHQSKIAIVDYQNKIIQPLDNEKKIQLTDSFTVFSHILGHFLVLTTKYIYVFATYMYNILVQKILLIIQNSSIALLKKHLEWFCILFWKYWGFYFSLELVDDSEKETVETDHVTSTSNEKIPMIKDTGTGSSPTPSASSSHSAGMNNVYL